MADQNETRVWVAMVSVGEILGIGPRAIGPIFKQLGYRDDKGVPTNLAVGAGLGNRTSNTGIPTIFTWHRHKAVNALLAAEIPTDRAQEAREELITSALLMNHRHRTKGLKSQAPRLEVFIEDHRSNCLVSLEQITDHKEALLLMDRVLHTLTEAGMTAEQIDLDVSRFPITRQHVEAYRLSLQTSGSEPSKAPSRRI